MTGHLRVHKADGLCQTLQFMSDYVHAMGVPQAHPRSGRIQ